MVVGRQPQPTAATSSARDIAHTECRVLVTDLDPPVTSSRGLRISDPASEGRIATTPESS